MTRQDVGFPSFAKEKEAPSIFMDSYLSVRDFSWVFHFSGCIIGRIEQRDIPKGMKHPER